MLHQASGLTFLVVDNRCLGGYRKCKSCYLLQSLVAADIERSVDGLVLEAERACNCKIVSAVTGPLVIDLKESFLYASHNLGCKLRMVQAYDNVICHSCLLKWRAFLPALGRF